MSREGSREQSPPDHGGAGMLIDSMTADERIDSSLQELTKAAKTPVEHPPGSSDFLRDKPGSSSARDSSGDSGGSYAAAAARGSTSSKTGGGAV
eukprot:1233131-Karenia_brevis.AAC.1